MSFLHSQCVLLSNSKSRCVQQPVKVFYDQQRMKFRLCPLPETATLDTSNFGLHIMSCGKARTSSYSIIAHCQQISLIQRNAKSSRQSPKRPRRSKSTPRPGSESPALAIAGFCSGVSSPRRLENRLLALLPQQSVRQPLATTQLVAHIILASMISQMWADLPAEEREF